MSETSYSTLEMRVRAVEAILRGQAKGEVAKAFGIDRGTLYRWVNRYQQDGDDGLRRKFGSGRPRKLEDLKEDELLEIVLQPASAFDYETDLWTVSRLHCVIVERYQVDVSKDTIWRRLREAGLTYQKPERAYYEADEEARQKWRRYEVPKIDKNFLIAKPMGKFSWTKCFSSRIARYRKHHTAPTNRPPSRGEAASSNPPRNAEIQGYSVFSGRVEHFVDRVLGENMGSLWTNSQSSGNRQARWRSSHVCPQSPGASRVSFAPKANRFARSDRLSASNAQASSPPTLGCGYGPGTAARFQKDARLH